MDSEHPCCVQVTDQYLEAASAEQIMNSPKYEWWMSLYVASMYIQAEIYATGARSSITEQDHTIYCEGESFEARCHPDEVILMTEASYGRRQHATCMRDDLGFMGCDTDVLRLTDRQCSGRNRCTIHIPDAGFDNALPCMKDLKPHFDVRYICIKVTPTGGPCDAHNVSPIVDPSGYLLIGNDAGPACPLTMLLPAGQRVSLTVFDIAGPPGECVESGECCHGQDAAVTVTDTILGTKKLSLCYSNSRKRQLFTSMSNHLELELVEINSSLSFLIRYEKVGCPDLNAPANGWAGRDQNVVTFGCHYVSRFWRVECHGTEWVGPTLECPPLTPQFAPYWQWQAPVITDYFSRHNLVYTVWIPLGIFLFTAAIVTAVISTVLIRRYRQRNGKAIKPNTLSKNTPVVTTADA